jgi:hypothetical protein
MGKHNNNNSDPITVKEILIRLLIGTMIGLGFSGAMFLFYLGTI